MGKLSCVRVCMCVCGRERKGSEFVNERIKDQSSSSWIIPTLCILISCFTYEGSITDEEQGKKV